MKPLPAAPLTDEDRAASFDWQVNRRRNWALWCSLQVITFESDRRDAELMLGLQEGVRGGGMPKARILETFSVDQVITWLRAWRS